MSYRNQILEQLNQLFSGNCPRVIRLTHGNKRQSEFHPRTATIELGTDADKAGEEMILTHETAHLCMAQLTKRASITDSYRFYDEGFASILGGKRSTEFRKRALATAARKAHQGEVSFHAVQNWSKYFGEPPKANYDAYDVGASFIFFVEDTYGEKKLFTFFKASGTEPSLDAACKVTFGESANIIERKWLSYLIK